MKIKLLTAIFLLIALFAADGFAQIGEIKGAKFTARTEIHKFDFLNATYEAGCEGEKVKVRNGHYAPKDSAGAYFELKVSVSYGDLTGDNIEEAIVLTECSGAVQNYDEGKIYAVKNHRLVKLAELEIGTKNGGSISDARIKNGRVIVKRGPDPNRCTNLNGAAEETTFFKLRRNRLRLIGKPVCKEI